MGRWYQQGAAPKRGESRPDYPSARPTSGKKNNGAQKRSKDGKDFITGWNNSKDKGLVSVLIAPYSGSKVVKSEKGIEYALMMAKIKYHRSGVDKHYPVLLSLSTGKCVLKEDGFSVNASQNYMVRMKKPK